MYEQGNVSQKRRNRKVSCLLDNPISGPEEGESAVVLCITLVQFLVHRGIERRFLFFVWSRHRAGNHWVIFQLRRAVDFPMGWKKSNPTRGLI